MTEFAKRISKRINHCDLKQNDVFYVKLDDDYGVIKIELILSIIDNVTNIIDCKLYNTYNSNFLCIKHIKKF